MSPANYASNLRRLAEAIGRLKAARKSLEAGSATEGVAAIDEAIEWHLNAAQEVAEEAAIVNWWDQACIPALAGLIPLMTGLVGAPEGGPVERLALKIGRLCRPYDQRS